MPALQTLVTPEPFVILVPSTAPTCVPAPTATKESTALKISTNAKPDRLASTMDSASTRPAHSAAIARGVSPALAARSTSMNAIPTPAKMTALVWMNVVPSAVSACQVCDS
jgi:hypothetical protein